MADERARLANTRLFGVARSEAKRWHATLWADGLMGLILAVAALGMVWTASLPENALLGSVALDDSYYYVTPARHLVQGRGFSFDGLHRTNGVQPLWALAVTLMAWLIRDPLLLVRAVCCCSGLLWVLAGLVLYRGIKRAFGVGPALLAATGWSMTGFWSNIASLGMENGLHGLLFATILSFGLRHFSATGPAQAWRVLYVKLGLLVALFSLARTESVLLAALLGVAVLAGWIHFGETRTRGANWRGGLLFSAPSAVLLGGTAAFSWAYFGDVVPLSGPVKLYYERFYAESADPASSTAEVLRSTIALVWRLLGAAFYTVADAAGRLLPLQLRGTDNARLHAVCAVLVLGIVAWVVGQLKAHRRAPAPRARSVFIAVTALFVVVHLLAFSILLPHYASYGIWYYSCQLMGVWLAAAAALSGLLRAIRWLQRRIVPGSRDPTTTVLALLSLGLASGQSAVIRHPPAGTIADAGAFVVAGRWMNAQLPAGQRIAALSAGYLSFSATAHTVVNLDGLMNDGEYFRDYLKKPRLVDYLRKEQIRYFGDVLPLEGLGDGLGFANGSIAPEQLRLVRWWRMEGEEAYLLWRLWPRTSEPEPYDAVSQIQFDAEVLHRYAIVPDAELGSVTAGQRVVTSIVARPAGTNLRHVVIAESEVPTLALSRATIWPSKPLAIVFADRLRLLGVDLPDAPVRPGEHVIVTRYWEVMPGAAPLPDLTMEMRILRAGTSSPTPASPEEQIVHRQRPCHGTCASGLWRVGEVVTETYSVPLPATMRPGSYSLMLGVCEAGGAWLEPTGTLPVDNSAMALIADIEVYAAP